MSKSSLFTMMLAGLFTFCSIPSPAAEKGGDGETSGADTDLNYAQVEFVEAIQGKDGSWCIYATVRHNDEGWEHYANAWQVLDEKGNELAWRLLAHPHDEEQPFEREKCRIGIPPDTKHIVVQAKCTVHGFGGESVTVDMSLPEGRKFKVIRGKR